MATHVFLDQTPCTEFMHMLSWSGMDVSFIELSLYKYLVRLQESAKTRVIGGLASDDKCPPGCSEKCRQRPLHGRQNKRLEECFWGLSRLCARREADRFRHFCIPCCVFADTVPAHLCVFPVAAIFFFPILLLPRRSMISRGLIESGKSTARHSRRQNPHSSLLGRKTTSRLWKKCA